MGRVKSVKPRPLPVTRTVAKHWIIPPEDSPPAASARASLSLSLPLSVHISKGINEFKEIICLFTSFPFSFLSLSLSLSLNRESCRLSLFLLLASTLLFSNFYFLKQIYPPKKLRNYTRIAWIVLFLFSNFVWQKYRILFLLFQCCLYWINS